MHSHHSMPFVRLTDAASLLGAASTRALLADLVSLTPHERRDVADLVSAGRAS